MATESYYEIQIDKERNSRLKEDSLKLLKDFYLLPGEDPQEGFARAARAFSTYDGITYDFDLAQRIYDYVSKGWFMYSSPVLSNAPKKGDKPKSMPISCFLTYIDDSLESLIDHTVELRWLSVMGGGVGGHWSSVRSVSDIAPGPIPFLQTVDADMTAYRQGKTRKGSYAAYMDVSHPDIEEFLNIRVPTGDSNRKCLNLHNAINISDAFMHAVEQDKEWNLVDPKDGSTRNTVSARNLWESILEVRYRTGEPYLCFIDTANKGMKEYQKKLGLKIQGSNLCFSGDTLVAVADDRDLVSIKQLAEESNGIVKFPVYSARKFENFPMWDQQIKNAVAFKTGTQQVITIVLDDGSSFKCTEDHKLAIYNGGYVEAYKSLGCYLERFPNRFDKGWMKVVDVIHSNEVEDVYDLTVEDNHNFYIITNTNHKFGTSGVLVHNCSEIFLTTSNERTAVCCLSSVNLEKYDEWKNSSMIQDLVVFLDNVLEFFIRNAPDKLAKAKYSASRERSIGLGAMGWHSYLQKNMIPFGSKDAYRKNQEIFSKIYHDALVTNARLASERGECPDALEGNQYGWRLTNMLAIAPNASSSTICGTSPSIEPEMANGYVHRSRIGSFFVKNKYLEEILETYGHNDHETWNSIITNGGSVQHLDFLTPLVKEVFKTFSEIDQEDIIRQAANRQIWIDQGQSVNLKFPSNVDKKIVNKVHYLAWKLGMKSLYYLRTEAASKAEIISKKVEIKKLQDSNEDSCKSCEG